MGIYFLFGALIILGRLTVNAIDTELWVPQTYNNAIKRADLWQKLMATEYQMMKEQGVFEIVPQPEGRNVVGSRWMYTVKWKKDGSLECYKVYMVTKGYIQVIEEDYAKTYASVARLESI